MSEKTCNAANTYEKYDVNGGNRKNIVKECASVLLDLIKVIVLAVPLILIELLKLIIPVKQKNIAGELALITGGGNGFGKAIAHLLADRGCNIAIVDIDLKAAEETCAELERKGVSAKAYKVDVSSYPACEQLRKSVQTDLGFVDILINNAGLISFNFLQDGTVEHFQRLLRVNIDSHVWMSKVFMDTMIERQKGHIVGISSMSGIYAFPWAPVYSTTKFAVTGFMAALSEQLRIQGLAEKIHTTSVCPYYISTRKDIMDFLKNPRFEPLTVEYAAKVAVDGILRNCTVITVPRYLGVLLRFMTLFPLTVQQAVRDYLMRESDLQGK